jgi:hypothetical protein
MGYTSKVQKKGQLFLNKIFSKGGKMAMSEYKVVTVKTVMAEKGDVVIWKPDKVNSLKLKFFEDVANELAAAGWHLKFVLSRRTAKPEESVVYDAIFERPTVYKEG